MTYDQLLTIESIAQNGSFKAASKALGKTQPSLSAAVKKLEEEFQIKIFSRENYRPELTPQGRAFLEKSRIALDSFRELETFTKEMALGFESEITISVDAICPIEKIAPAFQSFFSPQVSTSLNLSIDLLEGLQERIMEHKADFAIGSNIEPRPEIEAVPLFETCMVPVISPGSLEGDRLCARELKKFPQIIVTSSSKKSSNKVVGALSGAKQWFTSDMLMKERLIVNKLGWGRLPLHQIGDQLENGSLVEIMNVPGITRINVPLFLLKSKTKSLGPNARNLWRYLLEQSNDS